MNVIGRVQAAISKRSSSPTTFKGARREIREIARAVENHSLWFTSREERKDGPSLAWFGALGVGERGADGLQLYRYRFCPAATRSLPFRIDYVAGLRLHAVARCLQRNGTLAWDEVKPILADAAAYGVLMAEVAKVAGLSQIAVHAGDGLFVGSIDVDGDPHLETYLKLDEALPSRWAPVRMAQLISMVHSGLGREDVYAVASYNSSDAWEGAVSQLSACLGSFKWLRGEYDPKLDPLSAAWKDYRSRLVD